jgi:hypothetical protein
MGSSLLAQRMLLSISGAVRVFPYIANTVSGSGLGLIGAFSS